LRGTSGLEGTTSWPLRRKNSRKPDLISLTLLIAAKAFVVPMPVPKAARLS
jgi:hypothetical protein